MNNFKFLEKEVFVTVAGPRDYTSELPHTQGYVASIFIV